MGSSSLTSGLAPALALACVLAASPLEAQSAAAAGPSELGLLLRQLDGVKRVLMIGAHPDDEDSSLLATLATTRGVETAYLALTRGDGGQNLIGSELGEGLGIVRTGELLAARRKDGARQFFSRAFDYGYSKTADEAFRFWPKDEVLADAVWVVRRFRPQVVVSVFSGTPRDGHGQHQAAGIVAHEVFDLAGDATAFPEQFALGVEPWQPAKLYRRDWRDQSSATLTVETGRFDPLVGKSAFQIGMDSRSQHQSQDMGVRQFPGPRRTGLTLVKGPLPADTDDGIFAGVDTTLASVLPGAPSAERTSVVDAIDAYRSALGEVSEALRLADPGSAAPSLARALGHLRDAVTLARGLPAGGVRAAAALAKREALVQRALAATASLVLDVRAEDDLAVPGEEVLVDVDVWNGGPFPLRAVDPTLQTPAGWSPEVVAERDLSGGRSGFFGGPGGTHRTGPADLAPGELGRWTFRVRVPPGAGDSRPYYLRSPRDGAMYRWPDEPEVWGLPRTPPLLVGDVSMELETVGSDPVPLKLSRPAEYLGVDRASGEYREPFLVVPTVSVDVEPDGMVWPLDSREGRPVTLSVTSYAAGGAEGQASFEAPPGWAVEPRSQVFSLEGPGSRETLTFEVLPSGDIGAGSYALSAVVQLDDGREYRESVSLIDYPHIDRATLVTPAVVRISAFPVHVAEGLQVGYVMGSGDDGPDALRQLGLQVRELTREEVRSGSFGTLDAIVLGVRAYQTRPDLVAVNGQLLEFVRRGGTVVVQYNQFEFTQGDFAPYPIEISRDRVSVEEAPVILLDPASPVLSAPNRITGEDFDGWVQERGLYFPNEWDERYTPLLAMADPGEDESRGSLLVARVGRGAYVYTALSFFRQFPAGVPGAYRLFANLVSLRGEALTQGGTDG